MVRMKNWFALLICCALGMNAATAAFAQVGGKTASSGAAAAAKGSVTEIAQQGVANIKTTQFVIHGDPTSFIAPGKDFTFTTTTGNFTAYAYIGAGGEVDTVHIYYSDKNNANYADILVSTAGLGVPLQPGYYPNTRFGSYPAPPYAGLYLAADSRTVSDGSPAAFQVLDAAFDYSGATPQLTRLAIRFVEHDGSGEASTRGYLLYNSSATIPADTSPPQTTAAVGGRLVTLTATDPDGAADAERSFYQLDGGPVTLYVGPFTLTGAVGSNHTLTYWSSDYTGNRETPRILPFVITDNGASSRLSLHCETGNGIATAGDLAFTPLTGTFTARAFDLNHIGKADYVAVTYQDAQNSANNWTVTLAASPVPAPLLPSFYTESQSATATPNGDLHLLAAPVYSFFPSGSFNATFQILDAAFDYSGPQPKVLRLAARFVERYDSGVPHTNIPAVYGTILFNAAEPASDSTPPVTTATVNGSKVALTTADPDGASDHDVTLYRVDGGPQQIYLQPFTLLGGYGTAHTVTYFSRDIAGNQEATHTDTLTVANTQPVSELFLHNGASPPYYLLVDNTTGTFHASPQGLTADGQIAAVHITYTDFASSVFFPDDQVTFGILDNNRPLTPGYYNHLFSQYAGLSGDAYLEIVQGDSSNGSVPGAYHILQADYINLNGKPQIARFAARFVLNAGAFTPPLYGTVLYNTTLRLVSDATPPVTTATRAINQITLHPTDPDSDHDVADTFYQTDHGAVHEYTGPFLLSGAGGSVHIVTCWSLDIEGNQETPHDIPIVIDGSGPITQISLHSDPGDFIGAGIDYLFDTNVGVITAGAGDPYPAIGPEAILVYYSGLNALDPTHSNSQNWNFSFTTYGLQKPITIGYYPHAGGNGATGSGTPYINIGGNGRGDSVTGAFSVSDVKYDYSGTYPTIASLTMRFVTHTYSSSAALRGVIRINSPAPPPDDSTPPQTTISQTGNVITLNVTDPDDPKDVDQTWYQIDGGTPHLYAEPFHFSGFAGDTHTITCWSYDIAGNKEPPHDTVVFADATAPQTFLAVRSDPGEFVAGGQEYLFDLNTGAFGASGFSYNNNLTQVTVGYQENFGGHFWSAVFAPPSGTGLALGAYENAGAANSYPPTNRPGLAISGDGHSPGNLTGRFVIFDLAYDLSGLYPNISRFGAYFEQHENGKAPGLYGIVRYNSNATVSTPLPPFTIAAPSGTQSASGWYTTPVTVRMEAIDLNGPFDVAATSFTLNGGMPQTYAGQFTLSDGVYTLTYGSVDKEGNTEAAHTRTIQVDTAPPALTASAAAGAPNSATTAPITVTGRLTDSGSGLYSGYNGLISAYYLPTYTIVEETQQTRQMGNFSVNKDGSYSFTVSVPSPGKMAKKLHYAITLNAYDNALNSVTRTVSVALSLDAPK